VKLDAERMQGVVFAIIPLTFNKLRDANGFTVSDGTRCRAEGSSGLAFSVASEDDQNPLSLSPPLRGYQPALYAFAAVGGVCLR
jgi:hypothetical protein